MRDDGAVSDVMGSILLIGITVTMFVALTIMVSLLPPPSDDVHAELAVSVHPGPDMSWSTGDEEVRVSHLYGEALPEKGTWITVTINGIAHKTVGSDLKFEGGMLNVGERWINRTVLQFNDDVEVDVIVDRGSAQYVMTSVSLITGETSCSNDDDAPQAIITQTPDDLNAVLGDGSLTVKARLVDVCSGINATADPVLEYWLGGDPATSIEMQPLGGDTWSVDIPAPDGDWANQTGVVLSYQITAMEDTAGNLGASEVETDLIDPPPPDYYYITNETTITGSMVDFTNMQDAEDAGAYARLREAVPPGNSTQSTLYGIALSELPEHDVDHELWKDRDRVLELEDNKYAMYEKDPDPSTVPLRIEIADPLPSNDRIIKLELEAMTRIKPDSGDSPTDDGFRLQACWTGETVSGTTCGQRSGVLVAPDVETRTVLSYDITDRRPGGGTWTWDDLDNIDGLVSGQIVGGVRDGDFEVSWVRLVVTHGPGYELEHEFSWDQAAINETGDLEIQYAAVVGDYQVEVWDWTNSQWNLRGNQLNGWASSLWSTPITSDEWNGGEPRIRITTSAGDPSTQGDLRIDFMRLAV